MAAQTELRLLDLEPQGADETVRTVTRGAIALGERNMGHGEILAHIGMASRTVAPFLEPRVPLELRFGPCAG